MTLRLPKMSSTQLRSVSNGAAGSALVLPRPAYLTVTNMFAALRLLPMSNREKDAEVRVVRHENAVLRRQLKIQVRHEPSDWLWFAALSTLIPRHRWSRVFPVIPGTPPAWHRQLTAAK
ncbi:hypothetical protein OG746_37865 [Streptomyces sp. NBC_01016]|uniref:hypothetical protein n=1 Tax=Streptomyces sp. NBC_01016 TaxID=2903720 RepID=UPI002253EDE3|nr:hypothetical protein [Streptomyces sp. NBC_01016]MCX4834482.1 hypothetical protein [Streptomyces sp. NBC_01016]